MLLLHRGSGKCHCDGNSSGQGLNGNLVHSYQNLLKIMSDCKNCDWNCSSQLFCASAFSCQDHELNNRMFKFYVIYVALLIWILPNIYSVFLSPIVWIFLRSWWDCYLSQVNLNKLTAIHINQWWWCFTMSESFQFIKFCNQVKKCHHLLSSYRCFGG